MTVDLGSIYWINRWVVRHMGAAGWQSPNYNMSDFKLQGSIDNVNWFDMDSVVGNTAGVTDRTIPDTTLATMKGARYVRVNVTKGIACNTKLASIVSFEVYPAMSPYLTNLTVSAGGTALTLTPSFAGNVLTYSVPTVSADTTSVIITPTTQDSYAAVAVNGINIRSTYPLTVNLGAAGTTTAINVVVTPAGGGTAVTYVVNVPRQAAASSALTGLSVKDGTTELISGFVKTNLAYSASVPFDTSSVVVTATPETSGATVAITCNGTAVTNGQAANLNVGSNTITVVVTAGGSSTTYTVTVTRGNSPYLSGLSLKRGISTDVPLNPLFIGGTLNYNATVPTSTPSVKVTPIAADASASVTVNGTAVTTAQPSVTVSLSATSTTITVLVSSNFGQQKTYIITVTKS